MSEVRGQSGHSLPDVPQQLRAGTGLMQRSESYLLDQLVGSSG